MSRYGKLLLQILSGASDTNVAFSSLRQVLLKLGFSERIRGSHHIFTQKGMTEILNLQEKEGKAKPYQVKQVREVILKYQLGGQDV
jgi:virulence-associated protein VapD